MTGVVTPRHPFLDGPSPRAFAHRGWHLGELAGMENSLAAFRRAAEEGYHYLETDVRATRDGVVVVIHDATLDRTTDSSGAVEKLDWAAVRTARVGGREHVCRLVELLEELPQALLNIDVKADSAVAPVLELLGRTGGWHRVCLASFSEARLRRLRAAAGPALLTSMGPASAAALRLRSMSPRIAVPIRGELAQLPVRICGIPIMDRALLRYAHHRGLEVHVWTVNRAEEMHALLDLGIDGVITDRPDVLRDVLRARRAWPEADTQSR
ncbi:MAG: glycerophosphodiester phosphodiesterase [Pseudonocardiales bacterium]|nr:glycerophosphodiester phosphodiesterase [Pseudonocardiales bacterium]MBV9030757.1 glycerophosphodiester phosphodiesterase [Pseudonocardiales bacterium]MBW0010993.1 glycerophosphodiester phosphodiesterase [Pseudonocardiales bacterium]